MRVFSLDWKGNRQPVSFGPFLVSLRDWGLDFFSELCAVSLF